MMSLAVFFPMDSSLVNDIVIHPGRCFTLAKSKLLLMSVFMHSLVLRIIYTKSYLFHFSANHFRIVDLKKKNCQISLKPVGQLLHTFTKEILKPIIMLCLRPVCLFGHACSCSECFPVNRTVSVLFYYSAPSPVDQATGDERCSVWTAISRRSMRCTAWTRSDLQT